MYAQTHALMRLAHQAFGRAAGCDRLPEGTVVKRVAMIQRHGGMPQPLISSPSEKLCRPKHQHSFDAFTVQMCEVSQIARQEVVRLSVDSGK